MILYFDRIIKLFYFLFCSLNYCLLLCGVHLKYNTMKLTKKQKQLETLNAKIEQFEADNYGYQLTPAKQAKADKMQADLEKLLYSMTEYELEYLGYADLILERFYNN